ncbi:MAG: DUF3822 family protein [Bacteroidales bacterium]|nr:DUF3822 family protein [Bacteroidales bacterium]
MNDFKFIDERYNIQNTLEYRLSIQVNPDGFSVLMCDSDSKIIKILHHNTGNFEKTLEIFRQDDSIDELKRISFKEINILINNCDFSFVPKVLYEKDTEKIYLSHSTIISDDAKIKSTRIDENDSRLIFKLDSDIQALIKLFKNSPNILHLSNSILPYIQKKIQGNGITFHSTGNILYVAYFKQNKLIFFNAFHYMDPSEMVFHAVNSFKKLNIDSNPTSYYYGDMDSESKAYDLLKKYFPELQQFDKEIPFGIAGNLNENYFSNLLESLDCVL